uniref:Putative nonstructural polyprotein n=1 Tax=Red panda dicistro-like virus TaxID=2864001 RepID=A0A8K1HIT4_9VIRU|nr:putative nonstructural polyprotein [Red panda dicistro-like virus]
MSNNIDNVSSSSANAAILEAATEESFLWELPVEELRLSGFKPAMKTQNFKNKIKCDELELRNIFELLECEDENPPSQHQNVKNYDQRKRIRTNERKRERRQAVRIVKSQLAKVLSEERRRERESKEVRMAFVQCDEDKDPSFSGQTLAYLPVKVTGNNWTFADIPDKYRPVLNDCLKQVSFKRRPWMSSNNGPATTLRNLVCQKVCEGNEEFYEKWQKKIRESEEFHYQCLGLPRLLFEGLADTEEWWIAKVRKGNFADNPKYPWADLRCVQGHRFWPWFCDECYVEMGYIDYQHEVFHEFPRYQMSQGDFFAASEETCEYFERYVQVAEVQHDFLGIDSMSEVLGGILEKYNQSLEHVTEFVQRYLQKIRTFVTEVMTKVSRSIEGVMGYLTNFKQIVFFLAMVVVYLIFQKLGLDALGNAVVAAIFIFKGEKYSKWIGVFLAVNAGMKLQKTWPFSSVPWENRFSIETRTVEAMKSDETNLGRIVFMLFGALAIGSGLDIVPTIDSYTDFVKKMDLNAKMFRAADTISSSFSSLYETVVATFSKYYYGLDVDGEMPTDIQEVLDGLRTFDMNRRQELASNTLLCLEVERLYDKFLACRIRYRGNKNLGSVLDKLQGTMVNLYDRAQKFCNSVGKKRVEPVVVMLTGEAGKGKSAMMYHLGANVLYHAGLLDGEMTDDEIEKKVSECIFARMIENEYWDGYMGQPCTLVDDFAQLVDSTANPNLEFMEIIRAGNKFPYHLHMAGVDQKANAVFKSRALIATTNQASFAPVSISRKDAFLRRIDMGYKVDIAAQYQQKVQGSKNGMIAEEFRSGLKLEAFTFQKWNFENGTPLESTLYTFDQVANELRLMLTKKNEQHEAGVNDISKYVRELKKLDKNGTAQANDGPSTSQQVVDKVKENEEIWRQREFEKDRERAAVYKEPESWLSRWWPKKKVRAFRTADLGFTLDEMVECGYKASRIIETMGGADAASYKAVGDEDYIEMFGAPRDLIEYYHRVRFERYEPYAKKYMMVPHSTETGFMKAYIDHNFKELFKECELDKTINEIMDETMEWCDKHYIFQILTGAVSTCLIGFMIYDGIQNAMTPSRWDSKVCETGKDRTLILPKTKVEGIPEEGEFVCETGKDRALAATKVKIEGIPEKGEVVRMTETGKGRNIPKSTPRTEGWKSECAQQLVHKIRKNQMVVTMVSKDREVIDTVKTFPVFFVKGRTFLINTHYVMRIENMAKIHEGLGLLFRASAEEKEGYAVPWSTLEKTRKEYLRAGDETDVTLLTVPNQFSRRPDLTKHIMRKEGLGKLVGTRVVMTNINGHNKAWTLKFGEVEEVRIQPYRDEHIRKVAQAINTTIGSESGDCGGVYVSDETTVEQRIVGFHFAGITGGSSAIPLVFEDLEGLLDGEVTEELEAEIKENALLDDNVAVVNHGWMEGPVQPMKTKLVQTKIFNQVCETTKAPALLSKELSATSPLGKGIAKQFAKQCDVDPALLERSVRSYAKILQRCPQKDEMRVLSYEEGVRGVEGDEYMKGINRTTSPGMPYCMSQSGGKMAWFGKDEWTLDSEKAKELKADVMAKNERIRRGEHVNFIFVDVLKDEVRDLEKVKSGKTRVFSAAPMDLTILFRMYFLCFIKFMMKNRIKSESCVGIKSQSLEWDQLAKHLLRTGNNNMDGDFANYDGTLNATILRRILGIVEHYYKMNDNWTEEDAKARYVLWEALVNAKHIVQGFVYQVDHSHPSGHPMTAILNSMYNSVVMRYAYYAAGYSDFNDNVSMANYGDDNLLSVSSRVAFSQKDATEQLAKIGMTYTSADKVSDVTSELKPLSQCSFLQRDFVYDNRYKIWVGRLKLRSILECFNWIHSTTDEEGVIMQNALMANIELAYYDADFFDKVMLKLTRVISKGYGKVMIPIGRDYVWEKHRDSSLLATFPSISWQ